MEEPQDPFNGDGDDCASLRIPLGDDDAHQELLGSEIFRNSEAELHVPRELVTAKKSSHYYFDVRCKFPLLGLYNSEPACLILFEFEFATTLTNSRYKQAKIEIEFVDGARSQVHPDDDIDSDDEVGAGARPMDPPKILRFEPSLFTCERERETGSTTAGATASANPPGGFGGAGVNYTVARPFVVEGARRVQGTPEGRNSLVFSLKENTLSSSGIFPKFSTPIIVGYTPRRRFAARIRVWADIRWSTISTPQCGKRDEPVYFDPETLADRQLSLGRRVDLPIELDLQHLTRLLGYGGVFHKSNEDLLLGPR